MYLRLFLIYTAVTQLLWEAWSMLLVIVPFIAVDRVYIPCEEALMELQFGDAYRAYCASVRRWLGGCHRINRETDVITFPMFAHVARPDH